MRCRDNLFSESLKVIHMYSRPISLKEDFEYETHIHHTKSQLTFKFSQKIFQSVTGWAVICSQQYAHLLIER